MDKVAYELSPQTEKNIFELFLDEVPKYLNPKTVINVGPFLEGPTQKYLLELFSKNHSNAARQFSQTLHKLFSVQCQTNRGLLVRVASSFTPDAFAIRYFLQCLPLSCEGWYRKLMDVIPDNLRKEIDPNYVLVTDNPPMNSIYFVPVDANLDKGYLIENAADWRKLPPPPLRNMARLRDLNEFESMLKLESCGNVKSTSYVCELKFDFKLHLFHAREIVANLKPEVEFLNEVEVGFNSTSRNLCEEFGGSVEELRLRAYQMELAEPSLAGHNVIVCARTGSGKTLVAIKVIKEHLDKNPRNSKIAFVVPSVPLVNQQRDRCRDYLRDKYLVRGLAGSGASGDVGPRDILVQQCHVTVMTPMILVHLLNGSDESKSVKLSDFSLLVLDECHHTNKEHPYTKVMSQYIDKKRSITGDVRYSDLPQVLGLTASLGVDDAKNVSEAIRHVVVMAANLDATVVKCVTENIDEFDSYNPKPDDEIIPVDLQPGSSALAFLQIVSGCMKEIEENHLRPFLIEMRRRPDGDAFLSGLADVPVLHRDQATYQSWLYLLIKRAKTLKDTVEKTEVMSWLRNLAAYQAALELNEHLPTKCVVKQILKAMDDIIAKKCHTTSKVCIQIYQEYRQKIENCFVGDQMEGNGLFDELSKILKEEFCKEKPGLTIIFARTRNIVKHLALFIQESNFGCKAAFVTSVNTHGDAGGMTFAEQESVLGMFRTGDVQVLVGTKVIAEGLDIPMCSLVIKYNHVGNEKDLIQIRGRCRAAGGRSILIARKNSVLEKELNNKNKEILMEKAMKYLQTMSSFNAQVEIEQKNNYETRKTNQENVRELREKLKDRKYRILCSDCDAYFCDSTSIRLIHNHRVSIDLDVWKRVDLSTYSLGYIIDQKKCFASICFPAKLLCPNCKRQIGQICRYDSTFFPIFKAESIVLLRPEGKFKEVPKKKWSQIEKEYFYAPQVEDDEKRAVKRHFAENIPKEFEEIMKLIEKGTAEDKINCDKNDELVRDSLVGEEVTDTDLVQLADDEGTPMADHDTTVHYQYTPMGDQCTPMGEQCTPMGDQCTPMGDQCTPMGEQCTPMGDQCTPMGDQCTPMGDQCTPMGDQCTPMGDQCTPMGDQCTPMGDQCTPMGDQCTPMGDH